MPREHQVKNKAGVLKKDKTHVASVKGTKNKLAAKFLNSARNQFIFVYHGGGGRNYIVVRVL